MEDCRSAPTSTDVDAATLTAWALVITAVGTLLTAVGTLYNIVVAKRTHADVKRVEYLTNGMKAELVEEVRKASFAAGEKSEHDKHA